MTNKYFLPAAVVAAGVFVAGAVLWSGAHPVQAPTDGAVAGGQQPKAIAVDIKNVKTAGNPFIGRADAPVTIAFWSDFQCPYCKAFEVGGIPQIPIVPALPEVIKNYVDTGKVKVVFFDFTFLGQDSITAALYNQSVWNLYPDKYFEWRTAMYTAQDDEGDKGFGDAESINALSAKIAGLDAVKIAADVKANTVKYQAAINSDRAEAQKAGVNATPSFVIGTQMIPGAVQFDTLKAAIDNLLK